MQQVFDLAFHTRTEEAACRLADSACPRGFDFNDLPDRINVGIASAPIQWDVIAVWAVGVIGCVAFWRAIFSLAAMLPQFLLGAH
ncbi:MAG TPA: hypothetical protein VGF88_23500 [Acidobacteriaceae bacterium]